MRDVLIVDYDPELREQASHVLNGGVYSLTFASDGVEALKIVKNKRFDLILVDLLMPGALNGIQILQGLHRHAPDSPLVVMSDRNGHLELETALRYGAKEVLLKPVHLDLMKSVADKLTGAPQKPREVEHEPALPAVQEIMPPVEPISVEPAVDYIVKEPGMPADNPLEDPDFSITDACRPKIFSGLPESSLSKLMMQCEKVILHAGEEHAIDGYQVMAVICSGQARCWYDGLLIKVLEPGETIGEAALYSRANASLPMVLDCSSEVKMYIIPQKILRDFFQNQGFQHLLNFSARIVQNLSETLEQLYNEMSQSHMDGFANAEVDGTYSAAEGYSDQSHEWIR
jgi:CheY-like chemotaxis protein